VVGRPIALPIVSCAAGIRDEPGALARLVAGHFIRTRRAGHVEEIEPYHDRVRELVVKLLPAPDARRFHRRIACALESSDLLDAPALVEHWLAAGDRERAAHYAEVAAVKASEALAFDRAAHHYRLLLELREMSDLERSEVQRLLADALALAGCLDEAADVYLAAAETGDQERQLELRRRALEQLLRHGRLQDGLELARSVLREVRVSLPRTRTGTLLSIVSRRAWLAVRGLGFRPKPPEQVDKDDIVRLDSFWSMTTGLSFVDPYYGTAVATRYLVEALRSGDTYRAALAMTSELGYLSTGGTRNVEVCERLAAAARDLAARSGQPHAIGLSRAMHGLSYYLRGAFRAGYDALFEGEQLLRAQAVGARWEIDTCQLFRMASLLYLGRLKQATRLVPELLANAVARGDEYMATGLRSWRSNLAWLALDEPDEARRQVAEAGHVQQRKRGFHLHHYYQLLANAQIDLYCGDVEAAWARVARHWRDLKRSMLLRVQSVEIEATYLRGRAALALAASGSDDRERLMVDARWCARRLLKTGAAWAAPLAYLLRAGEADLRGDAEATRDALVVAVESCEENDMGLHGAVARYRLGQLVGGDRGDAHSTVALSWMRDEAIASPGAMVELFAPAGRGSSPRGAA